MTHFSSSQESHKVGSAGGVNEERKHRGIRHLPKSQTNKHVELGHELTSWSLLDHQEILHIHLNKLIFSKHKRIIFVTQCDKQTTTLKHFQAPGTNILYSSWLLVIYFKTYISPYSFLPSHIQGVEHCLQIIRQTGHPGS